MTTKNRRTNTGTERPSIAGFVIKKRPQRPSFVPKGTHKGKCPVCNSWLQKSQTEAASCAACAFRQTEADEAMRFDANKEQPIKPNVRIGKL